MSLHRIVGAAAVGSLVALGSFTATARSSTAPVDLGTDSAFAVIGGSTVTSAGASVLTGDLAVSPGVAVIGFPPGTLNGTLYVSDATAVKAQADLVTALGDAAGRSGELIDGDLTGLTLTPGVYGTGAGLALAGTLTLDAQGDPNAVFILQAASTLVTAANSAVDLVGGAQACNVFWAVGSSATLGADSVMNGTVMAATAITMGSELTLDGRALARDAAVTIVDDTVTAPKCNLLTNTAPAITPFTVKLTGLTQTVHTALGAWDVNDATGTGAGYSVTVAATNPTVDGSAAGAGTGASITLTPTTATAATSNPAPTGPVAEPAQTLGPTPSTIDNAPAGTGQGEWDFAADNGTNENLAVVIPGDASAGAYSSTLTFTTAPPAR
jgi:ethanolamine utilization microcompartment shell protein EutS